MPKDDAPTPRRPTNLTLSRELLEQARSLGINISRAAERGIEAEVAAARAKARKEEIRPALEAANEYIEKHGLPLARYRQF